MADKEITSDEIGLEIVQDAKALTDYAAGLSFALPNKELLTSFSSVIESQRESFNSILVATNQLQVQNENYVSLVNEAILPISSVLTDIGLASANATKLFSGGVLTNTQLQATSVLSTLVIDTLSEQQRITSESFATIKSSGAIEFLNEISPSVQMVSTGVREMVRAFPTYPSDTEVLLPSLESTKDNQEIAAGELINHQARLDSILEEIDPELVTFRRGVWVAFNNRGSDYIGQASSSMRRLVDNLLRALAPEEKVKETEFFKSDPKAKDKNDRPTRKARVLYLVDWDSHKAEHLERLTTGFLEAYGNLSAWDHAPLSKDGFVHGALIAIEGHLLSILTVGEKGK